MKLLLLTILWLYSGYANGKCNEYRPFPDDKTRMVCVCDPGQCHRMPALGNITAGSSYHLVSSMAGLRLDTKRVRQDPSKIEGLCASVPKNGLKMKVKPSKKFQEMIGFGGAMTDAAAMNIDRMDNDEFEERLLGAYFSDEGLEYTLIRIPMASSDFSTREYSYVNTPNDFTLDSFHLAEEDDWKIKFIRKAQKMARYPIKAFGSPWSAPAWMKTTGHMKGGGKLNPGANYSEAWAQYFVRFIEDYNAQGVPIWGVTVQNEPSAGEDGEWKWQAMYFPPEDQANFVANHLGPALKQSKVASSVKIMIHDDFRGNLPEWADRTLANKEAAKYVDGIGVHWYGKADPERLSQTKEHHPDKFILGTEACAGSGGAKEHVRLGDWGRAEAYMVDMIQDFSHQVSGWVDWNLALDMGGGPNWVGNFVDSPILVNHTAHRFYLQPMLYAIAHFSKFVKPGAYRIDSSMQGNEEANLQSVAFENPDGMYIPINPYFFRIDCGRRL
ncbi:unnamed protein product, partial [Mesorhabditis spiculigera]